MRLLHTLPLAALTLTAACVSDSYGYAPQYPPGYDSGMGTGNYYQPGDLFGGQNVADVHVFYEPLAPYGDWVQSQFGYAFRPRVDANWRPYVNGQWGENRLWLSNDPWGWATDHYGRWGYDQRIGWVWVPGTEWAPSWVAWREDDTQQVAGWAPVPPGVAWTFAAGFGSALAYSAWNDWYAPSWVWVPRANLYRPGFGGSVLPWHYGQRYWGSSHWNTNPGWNGRPPNWNNTRPPGWNNGRPPTSRPPQGNRPPGDGNWQGRPPGSGNGNWQGRPPGNGEGNWQGRPPTNGSGNWQGRPPGNGDGNWQGRPPGNGSGNWQGRPPGNGNGNWQGRPPGSGDGNAQGRPPTNGNGNWQGRPPGSGDGNAQGRPPGNGSGNWQGRPPGNGTPQGRPPGGANAGRPPQQAATAPPAERPAPPPRQQPPRNNPRTNAESGAERPQ